jgi:L-alanine-DL-glutamate epimerase-like enolase superfamily enzyme
MGAWSGLEMACWDMVGKDRNRPVHAMIGGRINDRIRAYTYLYPQAHHPLPAFWADADMAAESAVAMVENGYTAVKFDPAGPYTIRGGHMPSMHDIDTSVNFCKTIRDAVGNRADLLFGTHGQFSTAGAIRMGQALEPFSPLWYEEPTPPDADMTPVTQAVRIPVSTGERLTTKSEFAAALRQGVQILQPALGRAGGIWECKKIAAIAETYNAQMAPHLYAGPIEWAANIQLAASIPNILMAETIETPFHSALVKNTLTVEGGYIPVPTAAGLGIDVDEELARAHPYGGDGLHLQMQETPIRYHEVNNFAGGAPVKV